MPGFGVFRPKNVHQRQAGLEDRDGAERIQPVYGAGTKGAGGTRTLPSRILNCTAIPGEEVSAVHFSPLAIKHGP